MSAAELPAGSSQPPIQPEQDAAQREVVVTLLEWADIRKAFLSPDNPNRTVTQDNFNDFLANKGFLSKDENGEFPADQRLKGLALFEEFQSHHEISREPMQGHDGVYRINKKPVVEKPDPHPGYGLDYRPAGRKNDPDYKPGWFRRRWAARMDEYHARYIGDKSTDTDSVLKQVTLGALTGGAEKRREAEEAAQKVAATKAAADERIEWNNSSNRKTKLRLGFTTDEERERDLKAHASYTMQDMQSRRGGFGGFDPRNLDEDELEALGINRGKRKNKRDKDGGDAKNAAAENERKAADMARAMMQMVTEMQDMRDTINSLKNQPDNQAQAEQNNVPPQTQTRPEDNKQLYTIDLVPDTLAFIGGQYRKDDENGTPYESINESMLVDYLNDDSELFDFIAEQQGISEDQLDDLTAVQRSDLSNLTVHVAERYAQAYIEHLRQAGFIGEADPDTGESPVLKNAEEIQTAIDQYAEQVKAAAAAAAEQAEGAAPQTAAAEATAPEADPILSDDELAGMDFSYRSRLRQARKAYLAENGLADDSEMPTEDFRAMSSDIADEVVNQHHEASGATEPLSKEDRRKMRKAMYDYSQAQKEKHKNNGTNKK